MQRTTKIVLVFIVAAILILGFLVVSAVVQSANTKSTGAPSNTVYFTIVESDRGAMEGMNGSFFHLSEAWPVIHVKMGETVIIHIVNVNSSEAHGFTISHYFDPGVGLLPGGTYTVQFVANQQGTFLITCLIFCAIHPEMDHGEFVVTP